MILNINMIFKNAMQDLNTFYDWLIIYAGFGKSTAYHYKSGLSACSKDFLHWNLIEKPLIEMTISEFDVAIQKAFLSSKFVEKNTRGNNMYSNSLKQYRNFLAVNDALLFDNSYDKFIDNSPIPPETERSTIISARIGQGVFREKLIAKYDGRCIVTGVNDKRLLLASHIRPWSVSTNEQRLSSENGLLLSPLYDKLFDTGLISFTDYGQIIVSQKLDNKNVDLLFINTFKYYDLKATAELKNNLDYHRNYIFLS